MSSHHIVRDDQEPALIIANGAACQPELLGQLLEWSPLVVVLDSAMERVMELDIKVDVLLGDFDRNFKPEKYQTESSIIGQGLYQNPDFRMTERRHDDAAGNSMPAARSEISVPCLCSDPLPAW